MPFDGHTTNSILIQSLSNEDQIDERKKKKRYVSLMTRKIMMLKKLILVFSIIIVDVVASAMQYQTIEDQKSMKQQKTLVTQGNLFKVYDPSIGESSSWYLNDHTFIYGPSNTWHVIGNEKRFPSKKKKKTSCFKIFEFRIA